MLRRYGQWLFIIGLALIAFVCGTIGFWQLFDGDPGKQKIWNVFYLSLQLFVLESGSISYSVPLTLNIARFLAPLASAWTILRALTILLGDRMQSVRLNRLKKHVIVCGLGRRGSQLVREFREEGYPVVAIELNPLEENIQRCRELGALVLVGDMKDRSLLQRARVRHARYVMAISDDDGANMHAAMHVYQLVKSRDQITEHKVGCFVHVVNLKLYTVMKAQRMFSDPGDSVELGIFNMFQSSARKLFKDQPLDRERIEPWDDRRVRLIVIGFGKMGECVVLQAAKIGHFANGKKLEIIVIDKTHADLRNFHGRYPKFAEVCDVTFVDRDAEDLEVLKKIGEWTSEKSALTSVAVCLDGDTKALTCALNINSSLSEPDIPIYVRMAETAGLASFLAGGEVRAESFQNIYPFGMIDHMLTREILLQEKLDTIAKEIHRKYVEAGAARPAGINKASFEKWEVLEELYKDSNRQQADHIPVKLRAIGCHIAGLSEPDERVTEFDDNEVELMASMEHARWCAERLLENWSYGEDRSKPWNSAHLVEWERLPEAIKEQNRDKVRDIPHLLELVGEGIYRDA